MKMIMNILLKIIYAVYNGIVFQADVKYSGDKDEISFEDLEGRRYYFKSLCNQIISTAF